MNEQEKIFEMEPIEIQAIEPEIQEFKVVIKVPLRLQKTVMAIDKLDAENKVWEEIGDEGENLDCCDMYMEDIDVRAYQW